MGEVSLNLNRIIKPMNGIYINSTMLFKKCFQKNHFFSTIATVSRDMHNNSC